VPQVSCRPLMVEFQFAAPFPFESLRFFQPVSAADREGKKRIYADPEFRRTFREHGEGSVLAGRWKDTTIAEAPSEPALAERNLAEVAAERGVHPVDLALDLALASDLEARFRMAVANTDEAIVGELLRDPTVVLGLSDAGAHASQLCDASFSTHLLGHWVRDKGVLTLEEAIRLLTSRGADLLGLLAQAPCDDHLAVLGQGLTDGVQRLGHRGVDETTSVDDDHVGVVVGGHDLVALDLELGEDTLGIDQRLRAPEADEADFGLGE